MSYDPGNPYASPTAPPPPPGPNPGGLQFMEAFNYVFRNPNWLLTLLLPPLCGIIPIVGPMVLLGYQFEVIESLHRSAGQNHPDFDFGRFGDYLSRGVWPFLVGLVAAFVLMPLLLIVMILPGMCIMLVAKSDAGVAISVLLSIMLFFLLIILLTVAMIPMQLRAGLMQNFGGAFDFSFIKGFLGRVWVEMLLQTLFMMVAGFVLMLGGMLLCGIGTIPATMLAFMGQTHLHYQLYEIYLSRGGEPIPLMPSRAM